MQDIIEARGLTKRYGSRTVVDCIDLDVREGEIFGILGPNGAGKSTAVECLGGLRRPDAGEVRVAGLDPRRQERELRHVLGMQLQQARLQSKLTVAEAVRLYAAFYPDPRPGGELLERFGLAEQARTRFERLSGGQQQRLSVALALIGRPRIAMLDELMTGLDPRARRDIWDYLEAIRGEGTTLVLVTHSMEEAQRLCDRVAIIAAGRITALGRPADLAGETGEQRMSFEPSAPLDLADLRAIPSVREVSSREGRVELVGGERAPQDVLAWLAARGISAQRLRVEEPTLDDAYLRLTGSAAAEPDAIDRAERGR